MDFLKVAFFVWTGSIFASQAAVISVTVYLERTGGVPELLYLVTCALSAIPFVLCFIAKSRGLPWSFKWGISLPLACLHSLGVCAVASFPVTASREAKESGYRLHYLVICLALALLTLLFTLVGTLVYHSCKAVSYRLSTATSSDRGHLAPPPPYTIHFMSQPSALLHSFDEEAQKPHTVYTPPPTHPHTDARPSRDRLNLTIRTDMDTQRAGDLILCPMGVGPSGIRSLERGGDTEMNSLGGSIKGEADRRFVVESSPKKHVRIGRGRDLA